MELCVVCQKPVDWSLVMQSEIGKYVCEIADTRGVDALTENQQVLWLEEVHPECYEELRAYNS